MRSRNSAILPPKLFIVAKLIPFFLLCICPALAGPQLQNLQLEVYINGASANTIGSFVEVGDGHINATRAELEDIGLHIASSSPPNELLNLDVISDLKYRYDERLQRISFIIDNALRRGHTFDLSSAATTTRSASTPNWGAVVNYDVHSAIVTGPATNAISYGGTALTLDSRLFSPFGTFEQSAIANSLVDRRDNVSRLDTSFQYSDQGRMITYRAGDTIDSSLAWTRPVRLGGLQIANNFALRPDLITRPLPTLLGTAAVPSSVDVYVNNIKTFSEGIDAGPYSLVNIPTITGSGNAQLNLRDSSGNITTQTVPFYSSPNMLSRGRTDWSFEGGFPRRSFGTGQDTYVGSPIGSATIRGGIFDDLTLQAHFEGGVGLANAGLGAVMNTGNVGIASAALAGSALSSGRGIQSYLAYDTNILGVNVNLSSQRTFGVYNDLASVTARLQPVSVDQVLNAYGLIGYLPNAAISNGATNNIAIYNNARPPIALDRISLSAPLKFDNLSSIALSFINMRDVTGLSSRLAELSYSRSLPFNAALYATAFHDFGTQRSTGFVIGLNIPLGPSETVSTGVSGGGSNASVTTEIVRPLGPQPGDFGWQVHDSEGSAHARSALVSYRSSQGSITAAGGSVNGGASGSLELRGAIVAIDSNVMASDWIDDSFALIKTGAPNVDVQNENRTIGATNSRGLLLVPALRSYQSNKISIDPTNLPVDSEIETVREIAVPADRAGVVVNFDVQSDSQTALVTFVMPNGQFVPVGSSVTTQKSSVTTVGYEGQTFLRDLEPANHVKIDFDGGSCRAEFAFRPEPGTQVRIDRVICK